MQNSKKMSLIFVPHKRHSYGYIILQFTVYKINNKHRNRLFVYKIEQQSLYMCRVCTG